MNKMINFSTFAIIFKNVFRIFFKASCEVSFKIQAASGSIFQNKTYLQLLLFLQDGVKIFKNCIKH